MVARAESEEMSDDSQANTNSSDRETLLGESTYDLLIVGGGPAGTAAAFRGSELGLRVLVVEHDDLMKRIRDYSKHKLILPGFGGGDRMRFPSGGELISCLEFEPIDKDEICGNWKTLYQQHEVPSCVGIELLGLESRDGTSGDSPNEAPLAVRVYDHQGQCERTLRARHLALALGRGVPRHLDIPGNLDGVSYQLDDPSRFVGRPACVIGGGTSAAEAVIAIARAKDQAGDPTHVYWSYRGNKMPRVSRALADAFFSAYVGLGNIRYFRGSEPASVVVGDDHEEYLSIRVDRRRLDGRPAETTHLEFPKDCCLAQIGDDLPEGLLGEMGIEMVAGGTRGKRRMLVNRLHESAQPNVYLLGDLLSPIYLQCERFDDDPAAFREVRRQGNIKSALRDGVEVAEVVRQRLDGVADLDVVLPEPTALDDPVAGTGSAVVADASSAATDTAPERLAVGSPTAEGDGLLHDSLVRALPGGQFDAPKTLEKDTITIGHSDADFCFPDDDLLINGRAVLERESGGYLLRDEGLPGGAFLRLVPAKKTPLYAGDLIQLGQQFLNVEHDAGRFRLAHFDGHGRLVGHHDIGQTTMVMGRDEGGVALDTGDLSLSRRHVAVVVEDGGLLIKDLKSANGTYLRVRDGLRLEHGDRFRVGRQQLVLGLAGRVLDLEDEEDSRPTRPLTASGESPVADSPAGASGDPSVTFEGLGKTFPVAPGETLCEVAEKNGVRMNSECHAGICGSDPVRVISGAEHLTPAGSQECETLEDVCGLQPGDCRLACMCTVTGPVVIEILDP